MKWFKHETDAHQNMKLQAVIEKFGLSGYGFFWVLIELIGKEGHEFRVKKDKNWQFYLKKFVNVSEEQQKSMLDFFAETNLIDQRALKKLDLYAPKLAERSDDYSNKVRRKSGHDTDNVTLEEKRIEEIRREEKKGYGEMKSVKLTDEEHSKLKGLLGNNLEPLIFELDTYIQSSGKRYKSHYATLLNWAKRKADRQVEKRKSSVAFA